LAAPCLADGDLGPTTIEIQYTDPTKSYKCYALNCFNKEAQASELKNQEGNVKNLCGTTKLPDGSTAEFCQHEKDALAAMKQCYETFCQKARCKQTNATTGECTGRYYFISVAPDTSSPASSLVRTDSGSGVKSPLPATSDMGSGADLERLKRTLQNSLSKIDVSAQTGNKEASSQLKSAGAGPANSFISDLNRALGSSQTPAMGGRSANSVDETSTKGVCEQALKNFCATHRCNNHSLDMQQGISSGTIPAFCG